jgi:hypothetical protein
MLLETETGRAGRRFITALPLKNRRTIMNYMRQDVNLGVIPVHEFAVHPDFIYFIESHTLLPNLRF